jgi:hypothetical protein
MQRPSMTESQINSYTEYLVGVSEHEDDAVAPEEHLANVSVLVNRPSLLYALARLGRFGPHLLDVLEHEVAVAVEGLDAREQLVVIPAVDEHLRGGRAVNGRQ